MNWGSPLQLLFAMGTISVSLSGALACTTYYFPNIYLPLFFLTDRIPYLHRPAILRTNSLIVITSLVAEGGRKKVGCNTVLDNEIQGQVPESGIHV